MQHNLLINIIGVIMKHFHPGNSCIIPRRSFLKTIGTSAAGISLASSNNVHGKSSFEEFSNRQKKTTAVRCAFIYPPTKKLVEAGYYSWPGSDFNAEGRQKEYSDKIREIEQNLSIQIIMDEGHLDEEPGITQFINEVKRTKPDGLLLIPLKKSHYEHAVRIINEVEIPSVVLATLGILLNNHINQLYRKPGVYLINSLDDLEAVEYGMKMIKTMHKMRESRIGNITGSEVNEITVPHLGTKVRTIPHIKFYDKFSRLGTPGEVIKLANEYQNTAKQIVQPSKADIVDAAKTYFVFKNIIETEKPDALMMNCLPGLYLPHKHCPPCMGFMSLRDEGFPIGCQSDLDSTLTLMLIQELFNRPGFQQNASMSTEKNLYFGAHCTSASKLKGIDSPSEPYILMSHCEAGWGCVPRVLWPIGKDVTMALYLSETNRMVIYSGETVSCPSFPRVGGCRTNIEMTINEVDDVCDVKGMHQIIFYGNYAKKLSKFCQLFNIEVVV